MHVCKYGGHTRGGKGVHSIGLVLSIQQGLILLPITCTYVTLHVIIVQYNNKESNVACKLKYSLVTIVLYFAWKLSSICGKLL